MLEEDGEGARFWVPVFSLYSSNVFHHLESLMANRPEINEKEKIKEKKRKKDTHIHLPVPSQPSLQAAADTDDMTQILPPTQMT